MVDSVYLFHYTWMLRFLKEDIVQPIQIYLICMYVGLEQLLMAKCILSKSPSIKREHFVVSFPTKGRFAYKSDKFNHHSTTTSVSQNYVTSLLQLDLLMPQSNTRLPLPKWTTTRPNHPQPLHILLNLLRPLPFKCLWSDLHNFITFGEILSPLIARQWQTHIPR